MIKRIATWLMAKRIRVVTAAVVAAIFVAGAAGGSWAAINRKPAAIPATPNVVASTSSFAYNSAPAYLTDSKLLDANGNANYSPASMWTALAIASKGAAGNTLAQMNAVLENARLNEADYRSLTLSINGTRGDNASVMETHNSVWTDKSITSNKDFADAAKRQFDAEMKSATFSDPNTPKRMSDWIAAHTHGMLKPDITLAPDEVMSVINTIYADGRWKLPFQPSSTSNAAFHGAKGDTTVPMMGQTDVFALAQGNGWQRVDLPFDNGGMLKILLPDANRFETMCSDSQALRGAFGAKAVDAGVRLRVPRFAIANTFDKDATKAALSKIGIIDAFNNNTANFSKLTSNPKLPLYISSVIQGTRIEVTETGAKAAAYTKVDASAVSAVAGSQRFTVDRPFLYEYASPEGIPLFIGVVRNLKA